MRGGWMATGLVVALAAGFAGPARAASDGDVNQCRLAGDVNKADQSIAACDRVLGDATVTGTARAQALSNRCGWRWLKRDADGALADCSEAIRLDPAQTAAYLNRGNTYLGKGDVERAARDFDEAVRRDPKSAWALTERGNLSRVRGNLDRALADFNDAIRVDAGYAAAYYNRGLLYKGRGEFDRALDDFNQSLKLDPNNALAYFNRGCVAYARGDNTVAIDDFGRALRLDPGNALVYFSRGVAYYVLGGHLPDAEADFRKANRINPQDPYAALWLEIAERRNNSAGHFRETAKPLDMTVWPAPLVRHYLGEASFAQTLAAADGGDARTKLAQGCEANFYGGELALLRKDRTEAQRLLQIAADGCPQGFVEANAALMELITLR
ncbi:tetratricopeptide repeat protein [Bradyrhizobium sp. U87765 SZCCT0131]|uniref:tetratricopeptide repeat protein n=1 Tax=unclassified Bradyrhizobium TaxID=2631580 RepID=UPI001BA5540A|nr:MULTISPECIES: tetratricopeptide repeat protein [unclassified Bradyrhizobium]MBR1216570.1 tetratricopeptide repeat protein [Bradyrhizobium sp. U87765 SZCCT0131]MBR1259674.1 tetratricopeptide repeat protein [Bradyrhizobium sp. U87765 SZCCT0134]MBR1305815.1 tetratricopeptide repeat protein [Bradyrhizobium sp. U87765 SZCCT0110]MBR1322182.1 tetratricopeptide repeat protein [Bradyrhizobium sp. U87765 SZCCT0109]MBR1350539.1 tetratricopeptide repeat protein [Bradyrhizobium sp. U87765 SZCCT0048]